MEKLSRGDYPCRIDSWAGGLGGSLCVGELDVWLCGMDTKSWRLCGDARSGEFSSGVVCTVVRKVWPLVGARPHAAPSLCQIAVSKSPQRCHTGVPFIEAIQEGHKR